MQEDLAKLYEVLKDGYSGGVVINPFFEEVEYQHLKRLYNRAINEGFAQQPAISYITNNELTLQLTKDGRNYPTYQTYCDRHKKPEMSIANSILGNNNSSNSVGQSFDAPSRTQSEVNQIQNEKTISKHEIRMHKNRFVILLFCTLLSGIIIGYIISNMMK